MFVYVTMGRLFAEAAYTFCETLLTSSSMLRAFYEGPQPSSSLNMTEPWWSSSLWRKVDQALVKILPNLKLVEDLDHLGDVRSAARHTYSVTSF